MQFYLPFIEIYIYKVKQASIFYYNSNSTENVTIRVFLMYIRAKKNKKKNFSALAYIALY